MKSVGLLPLIRYEFTQTVVRNRSVIVFPAFLLLAYLGTQLVFAEAANTQATFNTWDILFNVFANQYYIFYVMTPVYLFLVSDFLFDHGFREAAMLRIGSRKKWWTAKVSALLISNALFLLIGLSICAIIASFVYPWEAGWSVGAALGAENLFLNPKALVLSPLLALMQLAALLLLGWTCLGLIALTATLYTGKQLYGFAVSMIIFFSGLITMRLQLATPWSHLYLDRHLLFNQHSFAGASSALPEIWESMVYWAVFIFLFFLLGLFWSKRRDLPSRGVES